MNLFRQALWAKCDCNRPGQCDARALGAPFANQLTRTIRDPVRIG